MRFDLFASSALICAIALPASASAAAPATTLHAVQTKEDARRGAVFLARHGTSGVARAGGHSVELVTYDELCRLPCSAQVDIGDNPLFVFVSDGVPVSKAFRVPDLGDDIALRLRPTKNGLRASGALLLPLLIGIPLFVAGRPMVFAAPGTSSEATDFVRLKGGR